MKGENTEARGTHVSDFRPPLVGCVSGDRHVASALNRFYCEALHAIVTNVRCSLECRGKDQRADRLFYAMAEEELSELRTLGELILALGGRLALCRQKGEMLGGTQRIEVATLIRMAMERESMRLEGYEMLLTRTSDRVVRSVLNGIMARHRRTLSLLEHFPNGC